MNVTGTATDTAALTTVSLTNADRCDRCGAQARVRAVLASGDLLFCAHHAKAVAPTLQQTALLWQDETHTVQTAVPEP